MPGAKNRQSGSALEEAVLAVQSDAKNEELTVPGKQVSKEDLQNAVKDFDKIKDEIQSLRKDFITVFGLFASLVTFLSIEVQIFRTITRFSLVAGISFFFLAAILLFAMSLHNVMSDKNKWSDYVKNPILGMVVLLLFIALMFFFWAAIIHPPK